MKLQLLQKEVELQCAFLLLLKVKELLLKHICPVPIQTRCLVLPLFDIQSALIGHILMDKHQIIIILNVCSSTASGLKSCVCNGS